MRESHTAVIARNIELDGAFVTEPYEAAWASEAIFFVRLLEILGPTAQQLRQSEQPLSTPRSVLLCTPEISPDGIHWCPCPDAASSELILDPDKNLGAIPVRHFGGWLRLAGTVRKGRAKFMIYLALKE